MTLRRSVTRPTLSRSANPAALLLLCCLLGCKRDAVQPEAPAHLPEVPSGYGGQWKAEAVATVTERRLVLPPGDDDPLALEIPATTKMAELSGAFAELQQKRGEEPICLAVAAARKRRCISMRPMSGEQFGEWLDAQRPYAKIRLVMRSDGIEVVTDRGKVPGPDRYGPSIPPVEGRPDFASLEEVLRKLASRFPDEEQAVLAPSAGLEMSDVAHALALLHGPGGERFEEVFLVYP